MKIELPNDIAAKATAAGFASVEEYVRSLVERDAGPWAEPNGNRLSQDEWRQKFHELLAMAQDRNPLMDDSRESIYADS
jgi:hypothetical protein